MKRIRIMLEKCFDGYVACSPDLTGVIVGEGDTYEDALADIRSAIRFYIETFGSDILYIEEPIFKM